MLVVTDRRAVLLAGGAGTARPRSSRSSAIGDVEIVVPGGRAACCTTAASSSAAARHRGLLFGLRRLPDPDLLLGLLLGLAEERAASAPALDAGSALAPRRC